MSRLLTRMKEQLLAACFFIESQSVESQSVESQNVEPQSEPIALCDDREAFSLDCSLRVVKIRDKAELLSQVHCYFPEEITILAKDALYCADRLNALLVQSRVCVVQNIDGDRRYALRMDTLLKGTYEADNIASFLENVTSDVAVLLEYFSAYLPTLSASKAVLRTSAQSLFGPSSGSSFRAVAGLGDGKAFQKNRTYAKSPKISCNSTV